MKQTIFKEYLQNLGLLTLQDETVENPDNIDENDDYFGNPIYEDYLVEIMLKDIQTDERIDKIKSGIEHNVTSDHATSNLHSTQLNSL